MSDDARPIRVAYADPPYVGCGKLYPERAEVDHSVLVARLAADYPDGWALSCHSPSLRELLPLCPADVRVMAWVKPFVIFRPGNGRAYAWEPVLLRGGRSPSRYEPTVRDWVAAAAPTRRGIRGAKPAAFAYWLFSVLGLRPGDQFDDLYPGTGAVTAAWDHFERQGRLRLVRRA